MDIGLTQEQLQKAVIDAAVERLVGDISEHGGTHDIADVVATRVAARREEIINEKVVAALQPLVDTRLEDIIFQETNRWGEKTGKPVTFREVLLKRAEAWMEEPVDYNGKTKAQDSYNWRQHSTRLVHMVDTHLQFHINVAIKDAMTEANNLVAGGILNAINGALTVALTRLKVTTAVTDK